MFHGWLLDELYIKFIQRNIDAVRFAIGIKSMGLNYFILPVNASNPLLVII